MDAERNEEAPGRIRSLNGESFPPTRSSIFFARLSSQRSSRLCGLLGWAFWLRLRRVASLRFLSGHPYCIETAKSVSEESLPGSTGLPAAFPAQAGGPPLPADRPDGRAGDSPDGAGATVRANRDGLFAGPLRAIPAGGSPTEAGESPALPILKAHSEGEGDPVISSDSRSAASESDLTTELLIQPGGTILAHNLTPTLAALLADINLSDEQMPPRAKALAPPPLRTADH